MNIDLVKLVTNLCDEIVVDDYVVIPLNLVSSSEIRSLKDVKFRGQVTKLYGDGYSIDGVLSGVMVLGDAITLEDVDYEFCVDIYEEFDEFGVKSENNLKIIKNTLDITEFLWQNILVEIPLKVVLESNRDLKLEGNGWRLITEDMLNEDSGNNSPFRELEKEFNSRKE